MQTLKEIKKEHEFKEWLLDSCNQKKSVIRNHVSRCRRLQSILHVDLYSYILDNQSENNVFNEIDKYAQKNYSNIKSIYSLKATLKFSYRNYKEFILKN